MLGAFLHPEVNFFSLALQYIIVMHGFLIVDIYSKDG